LSSLLAMLFAEVELVMIAGSGVNDAWRWLS
jgi:hypothetical protein